MLKKKIKVLVVDDTIVYRKAVSDIIEELPETELLGVAHNGKIALSKIQTLKPDLITLDIEMPVMNGLELLAEINRLRIDVGVIMLSTLTAQGSSMTLKALELGAFDFMLKPQSQNQIEGKKEIKRTLQPIVRAFSRSLLAPAKLRKTKISGIDTPQKVSPSFSKKAIKAAPPVKGTSFKGKSEIVTIGVSTGGPNALANVLQKLPSDIGVPIVIVQHMPPVFTQSLAKSLDKKSKLTIKEAEDKEFLENNTVYIAPGGKQMKLVASADGVHRQIKITNDPPENSCKPAADYLFRSVADYYVGRTTAVIMTGMGSDGTKGLETIKNKGGYVIAQDEKTSVVYGMPKAAVEKGLTDIVVPLNKIADEILKSLK